MRPRPEARLHPSALVRTAQPADALEVARVHVRSWQIAYRGLLADAYLDALRPEQRATRYTFGVTAAESKETIVAVDDERIRGFATVGRATDEIPRDTGELLALYVDPTCWRQGVGRLLILEARERLSAPGFTQAILWVLEGNELGERFYRADGWAPDGARRHAVVWGITVSEVRMRRSVP